eukprot:jgi/Tetstr1/457186/TSEL_043835.t1
MAGSKAKTGRILVKLLSSAGTGFFYVTSKNPRKTPKKLAFVKYDPKVDRRVLFEETKLNNGLMGWAHARGNCLRGLQKE